MWPLGHMLFLLHFLLYPSFGSLSYIREALFSQCIQSERRPHGLLAALSSTGYFFPPFTLILRGRHLTVALQSRAARALGWCLTSTSSQTSPHPSKRKTKHTHTVFSVILCLRCNDKFLCSWYHQGHLKKYYMQRLSSFNHPHLVQSCRSNRLSLVEHKRYYKECFLSIKLNSLNSIIWTKKQRHFFCVTLLKVSHTALEGKGE